MSADVTRALRDMLNTQLQSLAKLPGAPQPTNAGITRNEIP